MKDILPVVAFLVCSKEVILVSLVVAIVPLEEPLATVMFCPEILVIFPKAKTEEITPELNGFAA